MSIVAIMAQHLNSNFEKIVCQVGGIYLPDIIKSNQKTNRRVLFRRTIEDYLLHKSSIPKKPKKTYGTSGPNPSINDGVNNDCNGGGGFNKEPKIG